MEKYLKELVIKNLQSHIDTVLTFEPGINMITGENSAGKSVIFRAMRFLAYNRPIANVEKGLLRKGKSSIIVKATMSDGSWVMREKGKDINKYVVYDSAISQKCGGPLELSNFGVSVPEEVSRILGMAPVAFSKKEMIEINVSSQNEAAFMLSRSNPEIARWIYSLTHLNDVRMAIDSLNLDDKRCGEKIKDNNNRIKQLSDKLDKFDNITYYENKFNNLEENNILVSQEIEKIKALNDLYIDMKNTKDKAVPTQKRVKQLESFFTSYPDQDIKNLEDDIQKLNGLVELQTNIDNCEQKIQSVQKKLKQLEPVNQMETDEDILNQINMLKEMITLESHINTYESKIDKVEKEIKIIDRQITEIDKKISDIENQIFKDKNSPNCPICGSCIDSSLMNHIIKELCHEESE